MITDPQRILLKRLLISPEWKALEQLVEVICEEIKNRPKISDNEWETIKKTIGYDGEERGIRGFIQKIIDEASQTR